MNNWNIGGHGDPWVLILFLLVIVTLPLSFPLIKVLNWIEDVLKLDPTNKTFEFIAMIIIFAVSALLNAVIIYFIVVFLSKMFRKLFGNSSEQTNLE